MTAKEILQTKEVLCVDDIEIVFSCKKNLAYKIIRQIKSYSDRLKLSGKIHTKDYFDYINKGGEKNEA